MRIETNNRVVSEKLSDFGIFARIAKTKMSVTRVNDKRLIPIIKQYLDQLSGSTVTESDVVEYIYRKLPEWFLIRLLTD